MRPSKVILSCDSCGKRFQTEVFHDEKEPDHCPRCQKFMNAQNEAIKAEIESCKRELAGTMTEEEKLMRDLDRSLVQVFERVYGDGEG